MVPDEEVLSRISIMFETGEAIKEINALNKAIEQLLKSSKEKINVALAMDEV